MRPRRDALDHVVSRHPIENWHQIFAAQLLPTPF